MGAAKIDDFTLQQNYLKELNINSSQIHNDFMVGDENVIITAINPFTGDLKTVVKDDKFML